MSNERNYSKILTDAEKAVQGVKDPELRRVAFQKILDEMLAINPKGNENFGRAIVKRASAGAPKKIPAKSKRSAGPQGHVEDLVDAGFFKAQKTIAEVKAELENLGHHIPITSLSGPLQRLCQKRILRRQKSKKEGDKQTFVYSNW